MSDNSLKIYFKQIHDIKPLTEDEELSLFHASKGKGKEAKEARLRLIEVNLPLVITLAKKYYYPSLNIEFLNFIEEGNIGLIKAVEGFDPDKGYKFSTYASWWIEKYFQEAILKTRSVIHLPEKKLRNLKKIEKITSELLHKSGNRPNNKEVAEKIDLSLAEVGNTLISALKVKYVKSLDFYLDPDKTGTLKDIIADNDNTPDEVVETLSVQQQLDLMMEELNQEEKQVLSLRFGLDSNSHHTYKNIAKKLDISATRARDLQEVAIRKLRKFMSKKKE